MRHPGWVPLSTVGAATDWGRERYHACTRCGQRRPMCPRTGWSHAWEATPDHPDPKMVLYGSRCRECGLEISGPRSEDDCDVSLVAGVLHG